jgi:hypothetical protein
VQHWRVTAPDAAIKLAPATIVADDWSAAAELEWVSSRRECRQLVVWFGRLALAPGHRRATVVDSEPAANSAATLIGMPGQCVPSVSHPQAFLYDPDPAVLAADLLGELASLHGLHSIGAGGAYLAGDRRLGNPLLTGFEIHDCLPLRPKVIDAYLAGRHVGRVEIKKRGVAVAPDALRQKLHLRGDQEAVIILTRIARKEMAIIAERLID